MIPHYYINVFWYPADECWIADVPDLRSCSASGQTPVEAVREVEEAMLGWMEVARERGIPIPEPRYHPAVTAA